MVLTSESKDSEDDQNELVDIGLAIGVSCFAIGLRACDTMPGTDIVDQIVALLVCLGVYPVVRQKREQKQQVAPEPLCCRLPQCDSGC